jgi:hypothetical protein
MKSITYTYKKKSNTKHYGVTGGASFQGGAIIDSLDNINGFSAGVGVDIGIGSVQGGNISVSKYNKHSYSTYKHSFILF